MSFIPRHAFPSLPSLPRSYFLGHHKSGLAKMKQLISSIDLVIECRDYRIPLTSRNPLFESALEGKERLVVYTKRDLGGGNRDNRNEEIIKSWEGKGRENMTLFVRGGKDEAGEYAGKKSMQKVLEALKRHAEQSWKLVGHRVMVVGMPNIGKSTLLNGLRVQGMGKGKVAATGAQPGVTRKVASGVKIIASEDDTEGEQDARKKGVGGGVYLVDTPGVFIPYVPDSAAMMKLALCGSVKDTIIPPVMLADYLLFHLNLRAPTLYSEYTGPTNDIMELLTAIARATGRLGKRGAVDTEAAALWMIQKWRGGLLGKFMLDDIEEASLERQKLREEDVPPSMNQARKMEREMRRARNKARGEL